MHGGDCDVFAIKYIELLSIEHGVKFINQRHIDNCRMKLASDLYAYNCDP